MSINFKETIETIKEPIVNQVFIASALLPLIHETSNDHFFGLPIEEWVVPTLAGGVGLAGMTFGFLKYKGDEVVKKVTSILKKKRII